MNFIPQCKVIGPYNYDRMIHNIGKIYAKRQWSDKWNDAFSLKIKVCIIRFKVNISQHLECEASCQLPVLLLVIYIITVLYTWAYGEMLFANSGTFMNNLAVK